MPTLVCGQMLALASFLFYRTVAKDKKRDHFLWGPGPEIGPR
jgi:hypothetical protein